MLVRALSCRIDQVHVLETQPSAASCPLYSERTLYRYKCEEINNIQKNIELHVNFKTGYYTLEPFIVHEFFYY